MRIGEFIHIIRPVIYCLAMIVFKPTSFKPYFISLGLDLLRLLFQRNIEFYDPKEMEEFKMRIKEAVFNYLLRNPFYNKILKTKILVPVLDKIFGGRLEFLKKIIISIIEVRTSYSLLM